MTVATVALYCHIGLEQASDSGLLLLSVLWLCPQSPAGWGQLWLLFLFPVIWCWGGWSSCSPHLCVWQRLYWLWRLLLCPKSHQNHCQEPF